MRFEGVAGEFSQHDFGQVELRYLDGTHERLHFFVSRLKYSRWVDVRVVEDEGVESLVRSLIAGFESFGGVPLVAVFDNPKTVVIKRQDGRIQWNDAFGQTALDYRFAPELCTPRRAQEKGSAENLVGFVKNGFFKVRRFHDRPDLLVQLAAWHVEVNTVRTCRATGVPPLERDVVERERLRALPVPPVEYALRLSVHGRAHGTRDLPGPSLLDAAGGDRRARAGQGQHPPAGAHRTTGAGRRRARAPVPEAPEDPRHGADR